MGVCVCTDAEVMFLPTTALQLMQTIWAERPCHSIIAADFDELPDVVIDGLNAPLVASTVMPGLACITPASRMSLNTGVKCTAVHPSNPICVAVYANAVCDCRGPPCLLQLKGVQTVTAH